jgi:hypothetical protein
MVLRVIVGDVVGARGPEYKELALLGSVADPIEPHVHGAGALLLDGAVDDSVCCGVVDLDRGSWLGMPHFF